MRKKVRVPAQQPEWQVDVEFPACQREGVWMNRIPCARKEQYDMLHALLCCYVTPQAAAASRGNTSRRAKHSAARY
eukprot:3353457-Pyramimonas_sp.AAC.1